MNAKNERIERLWKKGIRDPRVIARKLGFSGSSMDKGIERVKEGLRSAGIFEHGSIANF